MRAMAIQSFGEPTVFEEVSLPKPVAAPGQIVIEVKASSVNPVDWKIRSGAAAFLAPRFPAVLHPDCAGVVAEVGDVDLAVQNLAVQNFAVGDEVWSFATGVGGKPGALAEFMAADARMVARKPKRLSFEEAASLPLVAVTAWFCLIDRVKIAPGARLLIQGGTGGVGFIAIQLAKALLKDVQVFATCGSEEKRRVAEALGADRAFNYRETPVDAMVAEATGGQGFDVVFNTQGQEAIDPSVHAARFKGVILDINGAFPKDSPFQLKQLGFYSVFAGYPILLEKDQGRVGEILTEVARLVDEGRVRPLLDEKRFTFAEVGAAHDHQQHGRPLGKVALTAAWT